MLSEMIDGIATPSISRSEIILLDSACKGLLRRHGRR